MTNPENSLSNLEAFQDPGFLYPLLKRANDAAAALYKYEYGNYREWTAKAEIEVIHGGRSTEVEYKFHVRVLGGLGSRWFTIDEAEMIVERLEAQNPKEQ
jgi:hypothetical protein